MFCILNVNTTWSAMTILCNRTPYPFVLSPGGSISKDEGSNLYAGKLSTNGFVSFNGVMFDSNVITLQ
jgi:hypothetical protein